MDNWSKIGVNILKFNVICYQKYTPFNGIIVEYFERKLMKECWIKYVFTIKNVYGDFFFKCSKVI